MTELVDRIRAALRSAADPSLAPGQRAYMKSEMPFLGVRVPQLEHIARTGAWWDHVDGIAHRVAALHDAHPAATALLVRRWAVDDDLWMRRLAIIGQLGRRQRLDREVLVATTEPNLADREFFVRKAIG